MTRHNRPTAIQTTLGDLAGSLSEIYRTAGYREPRQGCFYCENEPEPGWIEMDNNGPFGPCPVCGPGLEGSTPVEDGEPSVDPDLIPDRWSAREDHMEAEALEYEETDDENV